MFYEKLIYKTPNLTTQVNKYGAEMIFFTVTDEVILLQKDSLYT